MPCFLRKSHVSRRKKCKQTVCHLLISVKVTSQLFIVFFYSTIHLHTEDGLQALEAARCKGARDGP